MDIQRGLPRQGPGNDSVTRRAITYCKGLPEQPDVLDIGCGPGQQSLILADTLDAHITAIDNHKEYLDELASRSAKTGSSEQVVPMLADMKTLEFDAECFDLIWAEGSAYIMGVANALRAWKVFLKPKGYLVLSELLWLSDDPPTQAEAFFTQEYPSMTDVNGNLAIFANEGYEVINHFTIPDEAWWNDYYTPLMAKLPLLHEKYQADQEALELIQLTEIEIDVRKKYSESYGYEFFIARKVA